MINSDQIHVAMTKLCGLVATQACQSNIIHQCTYEKKELNVHSNSSISLFFLCQVPFKKYRFNDNAYANLFILNRKRCAPSVNHVVNFVSKYQSWMNHAGKCCNYAKRLQHGVFNGKMKGVRTMWLRRSHGLDVKLSLLGLFG